jgi:energy-coupling factor transporter ATP-binding protein EcfA2
LPPDNPFVGVRPFRPDEALLFFGRRRQTMDLLDRLHRSRFLAVVGSSGCGKSSLVLAGLLPQLEAGFLVDNRDRWLVVRMTPGGRPLERIAAHFGLSVSELRESGAHGIVGRLDSEPGNDEKNCLILVDQFEELFRFALWRGHEDEAAEFVQTLLALVEQEKFPVFVVLTMRSDFLGDCDKFRGLPEALNKSQYLVPRLTRQQLKESLEGPARLFGAGVASRLMDRILNEVGDDPDQLAILQLAMMRSWERWTTERARPWLDVPEYLAAGGVKDCVSQDAESAMSGMTEAEKLLAERIFQALTDTDHSNRRVRRPARLDELEQITGAGRAEILAVIDRFREGGRSFLTMQDGEADTAVIDISHEALIRKWDRLRAWVDAEAISRRVYLDLVDAVLRKKALLHDSDLQAALEWRARLKPTPAWGERYAPGFASAMAFLEASEHERTLEEGRERQRRQERERARRFKWLALGSMLALVALGIVAWSAYRSGRAAVHEATLVKEQQAKTEAARGLAEAERRRAEAALETSRRSLLIRQAALSNDLEALSNLTASMAGATPVQFKATRTPLGYKNPSGQDVFNFEMFPDPKTLPSGDDAVAFITYLADHPTFRNTLMTAGASRGFRVSYIGWGCLTRIVAVIEYKDPTKPAITTDFDMCARIEPAGRQG